MLSEEEQVKELYAQATAELDPNLPLLEALEQRGEIFTRLAEEYPSEETCCFLRKQLLKPENQFISYPALEYIVDNCYDKELEAFLKIFALFDGFAASLYAKQHSPFGRYLFSYADEMTGDGYSNPVEEYADADDLEMFFDFIEDKGFGIKTEEELRAALKSVSEYLGWDILKGSQSAEHLWHDDNTRQILINHAKYAVDESLPSYDSWVLRSDALEYLAQYWPDDETRQLLKECMEQDHDVYETALQLLEQHWPNDATKDGQA